MNFFQSLKYLPLETADRLIVSVLFYNNCVGDDARKKVPLLLLKGIPQELDEGFFKLSNSPQKKPPNYLPIWSSFSNKRNRQKLTPQWKKKTVQKRLFPKFCQLQIRTNNRGLMAAAPQSFFLWSGQLRGVRG
jgi:hypothetical protein